MNKGFAETFCLRVNGLQEYCRKAKAVVGSALPYWDPESNNYLQSSNQIKIFRETNARQPSNLTQKCERTCFT